jgi:hypothetical protein
MPLFTLVLERLAAAAVVVFPSKHLYIQVESNPR